MSRLAVLFMILTGIALMALPLVMTAYISLFADSVISFPPPGYTLSWYGRLFEFPRLAESLNTSLRIAGSATLVSLVFGVPASLALVRYHFPGRGFLNVLLLSPLTVPGVVLGLGLYAAMVEAEIWTRLPILGSKVGLFVAHVLITVPWTIRLCVANFRNLDTSMEEAAASLGAWPGRVIWSVTLPMIRPGIVAAALFSFIVSFENVDMTLFLISPGMTTFPISVLQYLEYRADPLVAAVAMAQAAVIAILLLFIDRFAKIAEVLQ